MHELFYIVIQCTIEHRENKKCLTLNTKCLKSPSTLKLAILKDKECALLGKRREFKTLELLFPDGVGIVK